MDIELTCARSVSESETTYLHAMRRGHQHAMRRVQPERGHQHAMRRAISMQSCQDVLKGRIEGVFECGAHLSLRLHMGLNEGDVID